MLLKDILRSKGHHVHSTHPHATLGDVVQQLVAHNVGSLVVLQEERMVGIITERDLMRAYAAKQTPLERLSVLEHMTTNVVVGNLNDTVSDTMGVMTEQRIRHLPVVDENGLAGIISIGDLVKAQYDELSRENHYLKNYIQS